MADDAQPYYEKIKKADAVVIGSPVYFGVIASTALAFIERFFGCRHVDIPIAGKPFVTVIGECMDLAPAVEKLYKMLRAFQGNVIEQSSSNPRSRHVSSVADTRNAKSVDCIRYKMRQPKN